MSKARGKFLLIDGNSLVFRALRLAAAAEQPGSIPTPFWGLPICSSGF